VRKRKWGLAAVAAALAVAAGVGVVMAQSQDDGTGIAFLDRVAEKLGIEREQLDQAIQDARSDELDAAVAAGDLTQEEADRLKERLDELPADGPFLGPGFGRRGEHGHFSFGFKFGAGGHGAGFDSEALAGFLGITEDELGEELAADGATLATVAEAHGKSREELKAFIAGDLEARLSDRVAAGDLTQERADEILGEFNERIDGLIDRESGWSRFDERRGGEFGFGFPFAPPHLGMGFVGGDLAAFLGIERAQLLEELTRDGASLATVAEAHGKTRDELKAFLVDGLTARLDEAVADDGLPRERADEILSDLMERLDAVIDRELPVAGGGFFAEPFRFRERMLDDETEPADGTRGEELAPAARS
jgi:hypothetical protein